MIPLAAFICSLLIAGMCIALILSSHYHDGFFGRIGLALITIGTGVGIVFRDVSEYCDGTHDYAHVSPGGLMILLGLTVFLARHTYRFHRFCAECEKAGMTVQQRAESSSKFERRGASNGHA